MPSKISSSKPLLCSVTFAAPVAIILYLAKASWNVFKEAWGKLNEEYSTHHRKEENDPREEQDLPFCEEKEVNDLVGDDAERGEEDGGA